MKPDATTERAPAPEYQQDPVYLERFIGKVGLNWESGWPVITLTAADDNTGILQTMSFTFTYDGAGGIDTHIEQTYKP